MKRLISTLVATGALLMAGGAVASVADAARISSASGGANIRAQPTTNSMTYGYFGNGTGLTLYCYTDAQWAEGTNRWFRVNVPSYRYGSPEAYINANLVADQYRVPHC